ncbi:MAG: SusD/RagB family nutrient-binding outer membrane lipoprotein [Saprospiraceae bacterium]|nr:SusD/RagB family nutrient-binding outer membrane lipoprotein [Saprospiraceae bacterium]
MAILDHERYFFEPSDFNAEWTRSYQQSLSDLSFVIKNGTPAQSGAAQILTANIFQTFVDLYGDIPYSEALKGAIDDGAILTPKYDDAKSIYDDLLVKIDGALANLAKGGALGSEDLIYGGDLAKWAKFGNSLKLKILVRQSNLGDASIAAKIKSIGIKCFIHRKSKMKWLKYHFREAQLIIGIQICCRIRIGMFIWPVNHFTTVLTKLNVIKVDAVLFKLAPLHTIVGMAQGNVNDLVSPKPEDFSKPLSCSL